MSFRFVDLFSGIGGFHAALSALGGECVLASDIDPDARRVYADNWNHTPVGDINDFANEKFVRVPDHEVLVGGFPCQPFSKSGYQKGMDESRGTLFWNIARIIEAKKPKIVLLENVRNLVGPRHLHEWEVIIRTLRDLGYRVSEKPLVISPHHIKREFGGRPQIRERVLIAATRYPENWSEIKNDISPPTLDWALANQDFEWDLKNHLPLQSSDEFLDLNLKLNKEEKVWIKTWDSFVKIIRKDRGNLPGFPIWLNSWPLESAKPVERISSSNPEWKNDFIKKNIEFFKKHESVIREWYQANPQIKDFPASRKKFEWQAQNAKSLKECILHFRPSGIRVKRSTYVPALVAITQTTILGNDLRRISVKEAARLQGFPEWFRFIGQNESSSYKQLGNAVNVGVIYQVLKAQVKRDFDILIDAPDLVKSVLSSPDNPDLVLSDPSQILDNKNKKALLQQELPLRLVN